MTTLREIFDGSVIAVQDAISIVETESPLDWPIWMIVIAVILIFGTIPPLFGWLAGKLTEAVVKGPTISYMPPEVEHNPRLRSLWANREGPYHPDPAERDRWNSSHGK